MDMVKSKESSVANNPFLRGFSPSGERLSPYELEWQTSTSNEAPAVRKPAEKSHPPQDQKVDSQSSFQLARDRTDSVRDQSIAGARDNGEKSSEKSSVEKKRWFCPIPRVTQQIEVFRHLSRYSPLMLILKGEEGAGKTIFLDIFSKSFTELGIVISLTAPAVMKEDQVLLSVLKQVQAQAGNEVNDAIEMNDYLTEEGDIDVVALLRAYAMQLGQHRLSLVILVDQAHDLNDPTLKQFIQLTHLEHINESALDVDYLGIPHVVFGSRTDLFKRMSELDSGALKKRPCGGVFQMELEPLTFSETEIFLESFFKHKGMVWPSYSSKQLESVYQLSGGNPLELIRASERMVVENIVQGANHWQRTAWQGALILVVSLALAGAYYAKYLHEESLEAEGFWADELGDEEVFKKDDGRITLDVSDLASSHGSNEGVEPGSGEFNTQPTVLQAEPDSTGKSEQTSAQSQSLPRNSAEKQALVSHDGADGLVLQEQITTNASSRADGQGNLENTASENIVLDVMPIVTVTAGDPSNSDNRNTEDDTPSSHDDRSNSKVRPDQQVVEERRRIYPSSQASALQPVETSSGVNSVNVATIEPKTSSDGQSVLPAGVSQALIVPKTSKAIAKPVTEDYRSDLWLLAQKRGSFTLQVLGASTKSRVTAFIDSQSSPKDFSYFKTSRQPQSWFVVLYGEYASRKQALDAISNLPPELKSLKPWVRSLSSVQQDIRKRQTLPSD